MSILRKKTTSAADLERKRTELAGAIERAEADVETAEAAVAALSEREARVFVGEPDASLAEDRTTAVDRLRVAREERARLTGIAAPLERAIVQTAQDEQDAEVLKIQVALERALADREKASAAFATGIPVEAHRMLLDARARVVTLETAFRVAGGDDVPEGDEDVWPDAAEAVATTIIAGPLRPAAVRASQAEQNARNRERNERAAFDVAVARRLDGMPAELAYGGGRLPGHLVAEVEAEVARRRADHVAQRDAAREMAA